MNDSYSELLIKKEQTAKDKIIKFLLLGLIAVTAVIGFVFIFAWIATLILGVVAYFILPNLDLEYEYVYVNGELDVDKIMSKSKRKRLKSFDLAKLELMAPVNSHRMDYQNHNTNLKVLDYSSGNKNHKVYAMIIPDEKEVNKVLIEPDRELLDNIKKTCPRKVFED
nr:DUF6106 family protein [uncultured Blautia sp.]